MKSAVPSSEIRRTKTRWNDEAVKILSFKKKKSSILCTVLVSYENRNLDMKIGPESRIRQRWIGLDRQTQTDKDEQANIYTDEKTSILLL